MSVTFRVDGPLAAFPYGESVCPDCGARYGQAGDPTCGNCYGFGGDQEAIDAWMAETSRDELNLANGNAAFVLRDVLRRSEVDLYCGSMEPSSMLFYLSLYRAEQGEVPDYQERGAMGCRVYRCGRNRQQVQRYLDELTRIATLAERQGRNVVWG